MTNATCKRPAKVMQAASAPMHNNSLIEESINQSINATSVAMRFKN
jgi:hypothetical protein